jgi:hypothetical protein
MTEVTSRDLATILAALRHWQATVSDGGRDKSPHFSKAIEPLSDEEIDTLCELLNAETVALSQ